MKKSILFLLFSTLCLSFLQSQQPVNEDGDLLRQTITPDILPIPGGILGDLSTIPAGDAIEGDYIGEMKFTRDGSQVWVLNRLTDNITVIDWATKAIVQNIPVGDMPMDIDFNDEYAVVPCHFSNDVYFIKLDDYSVASIQPVAVKPSKVHVSEAGNVAVVGCDEADIAEVFSLSPIQKTLTINDFPIYLSKFSFITSNPRNSVYFSNFRITPDEVYVVNAADENGMKFWDLSTGEVTATIPQAGDCDQLELSVDGTKVISMKPGNPGYVNQVDIATQSFLKQVMIADANVASLYSPPAVNADGSRVLVPTLSGGNTALVNFDTETWQYVNSGNTPDWVGRNEDGSLFIAGDYYLAVIDAETGVIKSSLNGISIQNGAVGKGNRIVASDPLRYESLVYYEFENPNDLNYTGESSTGSDLEADATYSVKFTPDGKKLLAVNSLSGTLSVIDVQAEALESIIPLGSTELFQVDVTSDGHYAVVAKRLKDKVSVIDLQTGQVVANVSSGGSKPDQVFVLPGDTYAYAVNAGGGDNIGVIHLNGAGSSLETTFTIGNTGVSWTNYGIRSDLKFTSDGYALIATPFDEKIQLIDLSMHKVVANLPIQGFPLQIAIAEDELFGHYAAVTLKNTNEMALFSGEGDNWSGGATFPCGKNPTRIDFDPLERKFWVVSNDDNQLQGFSLETYAFTDEVNYSGRTPLAVRYDQNGRRFTLLRSANEDTTPHQLEVAYGPATTTYNLPALPIHHFDISPDGTLAAVPHPGTDEVTLLKEEALGFRTVLISLREQPYRLYPNPATDALHFQLKEGAEPRENVSFRLMDETGKMVWERTVPAGEAFSIPRQSSWAGGIYFYALMVKGSTFQSGKVLVD
ncbi:MAG: hypothetical protein H6563_14235 [Lewinellaceae bacterium]|nr:hypothetical protein [Lewinellaceae bacterium]